MHLKNENVRDLAGLQVQVAVISSYGIISLSCKRRHNCFPQLRSINEYLVIAWGGHDRWLGSNIMQQTGTWWPSCPVPKPRHSQYPWMTLATLQMDCGGLVSSGSGAISVTELKVDTVRLTSFRNDVGA